ncbi:HTH-type transcriptional activator RhaS [Ralstonia psammae]|uniref:HTH-type transcriptional activator RhaS n=1 Tax=Ralstonia psammae TaxID=3058598 RepID=A0ABM9JAQ8_9RALS|nr:AraC family transcriptional regulator [Ralstonia sp. LMG 19083]CAJ0787848.1 HTH-type transcriptional activator RhaS [Ralstonia sp. LMG 19083]
MNAAIPAALLEPAPVSLRSSEGLGWDGFAATLLGIRPGTYRVPAMAQHRVNVHVGAPVRANCVCDGRRYSRIQAHGDADVIPAGLPGMWTDDADCRILRIAITDTFVRSIGEQLGAPADITPRLQWRDARVHHLAAALGAELEAQDTSDVLYAESLCTALVVRLLNSSRDVAAGVANNARRLPPRVAARVIDYIEAHLHQRLTLAELAAQAGLSVPHFNVLFRATLGVPVHRYVVRRRVDRAKALLLEGRRSASQIALEVGFAHQSHMTQWMQRLLGATPRDVVRAGKAAAASADTAA